MVIKTGEEITNELNAIHRKRFHSQSYVEIDFLMKEIKELEEKKYKEIEG